jgi:hypothetical protein
MGYDYWQLSRIWTWDKNDPNQIGPLAVFLPVVLYGKIAPCLHVAPPPLTTARRRIRGGFFTFSLDYVSRRKTILWVSLGRGGDVCTMPFPLLLDNLYLSALWSSPYTWLPRLCLTQWGKYT